MPPPTPRGRPCPPAGCSPLGFAGGDVDGGAGGPKAGREDVHPHLHLALHHGAAGGWYRRPCPCAAVPLRPRVSPMSLPPALSIPPWPGVPVTPGFPLFPQHPTKSPQCPHCVSLYGSGSLSYPPAGVPVCRGGPCHPRVPVVLPSIPSCPKVPITLGSLPSHVPITPGSPSPLFSTPPCPGAPVTVGSLSHQGPHLPPAVPLCPRIPVSPPSWHPHLLQPGLGAVVEGPRLEVLGDKATGAEHVQGQALPGRPRVPVRGGAALCKAEPSHHRRGPVIPPQHPRTPTHRNG